jgi:hypothetical protein
VTILAKIVDAGQLLEVVEASALAGVGVCLAFSLVIRGAVRAGERRQQSRPLVAGAYATMAVVALLACLAAIGIGVSTMLSK